VHSLFSRYARRSLSALLCAAAVIAAGCHNNNNTSGYGIGWVTLTDEPGDFTSYIVNVDSVTLTGKNVGVVTALATVETVDFTKLRNISELWASASIPNDTYTSASITLDYTSAVISVMVNGVPTKTTVVSYDGSPVTTVAVNVTLDPVNQLVVIPTYATTFAERLAINFDLPASNVVNMATSPPTVTVNPFMTIATSAPDNKPIRVRGPLINSSLNLDTYTVYVRPFYDEENSLGAVSLFNDANTVYSINGINYVGPSGLNVLSQLSAGATMTAAYTTLEPTATPSAIAGIFHTTYVIAGSTLEDQYTEGIEGDVIARHGNVLTLRGATLDLNTADVSEYIDTPDSVVLLGPGTIVTADDNSALTGLNYNSISVGQHITARGIYSLTAAGVTTIDSTGTSSTNTGSVRIQSTEVWGSLLSSASGSVTMELATINDWPASIFDFTGTGSSAASPANYVLETGALTLPAGTVAGDSVWADGVVTPFGSAPPDFHAFSLNNEASVQVVNVPANSLSPPTAGITTCGQGNQDCVPASMQVYWAAGTAAPFATLTDTGLTINLSNASLTSAIIRIGPESFTLASLPATPSIIPVPSPPTGTPGVAGAAGLPAVFLPLFTVGNPTTANETTTTPASGSTTTTPTTFLLEANTFSTFVTNVNSTMSATNPARHFVASGFYNRATNIFNASSIDVVL
jgi:sulfur transfer complex TusBCD TusB component (DsrH family)